MTQPSRESLVKNVRTALALADHTARTGEKTTGRYANVMRRGFDSLRQLAAQPEPLREGLAWALDNLDAEDEVLGAPVDGEQTTYTITHAGRSLTMARSTQYAENMRKARAALSEPHDKPLSRDVRPPEEG